MNDSLSAAKRLARETVRGLWIAIATPFTTDGRHVDEVVHRRVAERVPVMVQVGHHSLQETIALCHHATEQGIGGIKNPRPRGHLLELQERAADRIVVTDAAGGKWLELHTAYLKAWLEAIGVPPGPVRPPLVPLTREQMAELHRDLDRVELAARAG
jgi:dihydrodipicolinate synthase/N-acetylneuraminate lyase